MAALDGAALFRRIPTKRKLHAYWPRFAIRFKSLPQPMHGLRHPPVYGSAVDCHDNAMSESWLATLEREGLPMGETLRRKETRDPVIYRVEGRCSTRRFHSALGCHAGLWRNSRRSASAIMKTPHRHRAQGTATSGTPDLAQRTRTRSAWGSNPTTPRRHGGGEGNGE